MDGSKNKFQPCPQSLIQGQWLFSKLRWHQICLCQLKGILAKKKLQQQSFSNMEEILDAMIVEHRMSFGKAICSNCLTIMDSDGVDSC